jgi:hypothetical protein
MVLFYEEQNADPYELFDPITIDARLAFVKIVIWIFIAPVAVALNLSEQLSFNAFAVFYRLRWRG